MVNTGKKSEHQPFNDGAPDNPERLFAEGTETWPAATAAHGE